MFAKLFLICLFIGINLSNCLQLEKLCSNSLFVYKGVEVNSIHKIKLNRTFENVTKYLIDQYDYLDYFKSTENSTIMNQVKVNYNNKIMSMYTDYYVNTKEYDNVLSDTPTIKSAYLIALDLEKYVEKGYLSMFKRYTENVMKKGFRFARILAYNYVNKFDIEDEEDSAYKLKQHLDELKFDDNITFAFQDDNIDRIHNHAILSRPFFTFNRFSKVYYDIRSNGTLVSDIYLPIKDSNYEKVTNNCLDLDKLPRFYHQFKKN